MAARIQGIFWLVVAAGLGLWAWYDYTFFKPILAGLAAMYGALMLVKDRIVKPQLHLSVEELDRYGERLSEATPELLALLEQKVTTREAAERIQKRFGIPLEVTLKYIIALGRYQEQH
jgi:hypothetical protein